MSVCAPCHGFILCRKMNTGMPPILPLGLGMPNAMPSAPWSLPGAGIQLPFVPSMAGLPLTIASTQSRAEAASERDLKQQKRKQVSALLSTGDQRLRLRCQHGVSAYLAYLYRVGESRFCKTKQNQKERGGRGAASAKVRHEGMPCHGSLPAVCLCMPSWRTARLPAMHHPVMHSCGCDVVFIPDITGPIPV